jgi:hypothetical protein
MRRKPFFFGFLSVKENQLDPNANPNLFVGGEEAGKALKTGQID